MSWITPVHVIRMKNKEKRKKSHDVIVKALASNKSELLFGLISMLFILFCYVRLCDSDFKWECEWFDDTHFVPRYFLSDFQVLIIMMPYVMLSTLQEVPKKQTLTFIVLFVPHRLFLLFVWSVFSTSLSVCTWFSFSHLQYLWFRFIFQFPSILSCVHIIQSAGYRPKSIQTNQYNVSNPVKVEVTYVYFMFHVHVRNIKFSVAIISYISTL